MVFRHRMLTDFSIEPFEFVAQGQAAEERPSRGGAMTPREKPTEPREAPKKNTSPVLKLFVYGTLKRGYWNHDAFCLGVLEVREAQVRGRLYEGPGFPVIEVPDEDILAHGTADRSVGRRGHTGAPVRLGGETHPRPVPGSATLGAWGAVSGELVSFNDPESRLPAIDRLEGFRPGGSSLYRRVLSSGDGERSTRARLGLHGRDDRHQAAPNRLRPLAEVRSAHSP